MKEIHLRSNILLIPIEEQAYNKIKDNTSNVYKDANGRLFPRSIIGAVIDVVPYVHNKDHQRIAIRLLGKGEHKEMLNPKTGEPFTHIPKDWIVYKNYNKSKKNSKDFRGIANTLKQSNCIEHTWKHTAVKSLKSALAALGNPKYAVTVYKEQFYECNSKPIG